MQHVVILYIVAQNSLWGIDSYDIYEIQKAKHLIPSDCQVIVYKDSYSLTGGMEPPSISSYTAKGVKTLYNYSEQHCSVDSATMVSVLQQIQSLCPAKDYSLVFWSHGSGWVPAKNPANTRSFGDDGGKNINIPVLRGVLEQFAPFQFILFDACFMQCIEVAYELKDVCHWTIGSPAEIPGDGAPYDKILLSLCKADIAGIVQNYHNAYSDPCGAPLSAIETSRLDSLAKVTAEVLPQAFMERTTPNTSDIQQYCGRTGKVEYFGLKSAVYHLAPMDAYEEWVKTFDWAVPVQVPVGSWTTQQEGYRAFLTDPNHYGGVSVFLPSINYDSKRYNAFFQTYRWYEAAGWKKTGW